MTLLNEKGEKVKLDAPSGNELPPSGFDEGRCRIYLHLLKMERKVEVTVDPKSDRLTIT